MLAPPARFAAAVSARLSKQVCTERSRATVPGWRRQAGGVACGTPRILRTDTSNIFFHFAVEEYLLQHGGLTGPLMYLWRPAPVITIGRHQNPWKECVLSQLEADGVELVRRRSGGGAVFQDPGCSVFTFMGPSDTFSIDQNFDIVLKALRRLGVKAEKKGRNDLTVDGKKISGSAFKHLPDYKMSLHHGTILVETDFSALKRYLTPDKRKLEAKGIASVAARVLNLKDDYPHIDHDTWTKVMVSTYRDLICEGAEVEIEEIDENSPIAQKAEFKAIRAQIEDPEFRFGSTPEFSHQLDTRIDGVGVFDVRMQVVGGRVEDAVIFSDALYPDVIDKAKAALCGAAYGRKGLRAALESASSGVEDEGPKACFEALTEWLVANVDD